MTTTNKFFHTKEQYLTFRAAFAAAQNSPQAKKSAPDTYGMRTPGWLPSQYYMLLNLIRGLPYDRGFTPITSTKKLANGHEADKARDTAISRLAYIIDIAKKYSAATPVEMSWRYSKMTPAEALAAEQEKRLNQLSRFLEPLGGAFTIEDLTRLDVKITEAS